MKLGKGEITTQGSFANRELLGKLSAYRKVVAATYVLTSPTDIQLKLNLPLLVSTKLDGELWFLLNDGQWKLISPSGRVISGSIEILIAAENSALNSHSIYAGELHVLGDGRTRVGDLAVMLAGDSKADTKNLAFAIFDLVDSPDVSAFGTPYSVRFNKISSLAASSNLFCVDSVSTQSSAEVLDLYEQVEVKGAEGLVGRAEDGRTFKIKPIKDLDVAIIGFTEKRDAEGDLTIRSLLFGILNEDGSWIPIATTGNVGNAEFRKEIYQLVQGSVKPSSYRRTSDSSGVMYRLVEPKLVVELKCIDLQPLDSNGNSIKHPKLEFSDDGWQVSGWINSVAVHNATVVRVRADKACNYHDIGWSQITRYLPIVPESESATLGKSQVIRRQVWTKESTDKVDVRKLVVWKTNKEGAGYPAFVVHWTDYSATRKSPLDREVRLAPTEQAAIVIAEKMISENIKKGWSEKV